MGCSARGEGRQAGQTLEGSKGSFLVVSTPTATRKDGFFGVCTISAVVSQCMRCYILIGVFSFAQHPLKKNHQFFFGNVRKLFRDVDTSSVATPHSPPTNPASPPPTSLESQMLEFAAQVGTDERALHQIIKMGNVCGHVRVMRFVTLCKIEEMMVDAKQVAKVAVASDSLPPKNDEATSCLMI